MSRGLTLACLSVALLVPAIAVGQGGDRVKITGLRFGLPTGPTGGGGCRTTVFKAGQWAPVYVDLECNKDTEEEQLQLIVETKDADDAVTEGMVELPPMKKGDRLLGNELGRLPYLK